MAERKRKYHRESRMSKAEIMVIMILFHSSGYRCLKHFYLEKVCKHMRHLFPEVVCKNQRIHIHKTFKGIAQRGKCSMGWFFGFKRHLICNEKGELLNFMITPGDVDDRKPLEYKLLYELKKGSHHAQRH